MNKEQSFTLVKDTFETEFNRERFGRFVGELLKGIDPTKAFPPLRGNYLRAAFRDRISSYERIGQFTSKNEKIVDVLIVNLRRETTLERGRTGLRNFAADYLQTARGSGKSAVLVAYVSPSKSDWRFSYVTLETRLERTERGTFRQTIAEETLTPAKRFSFLVGENENTHTAQRQFTDLLMKDERPTLEEIETAFSVEKVTKEFFTEYKTLFEKTRDAILDYCRENKDMRNEFLSKGMYSFKIDDDGIEILDEADQKVKEVNADDFAKKMLGQIVFLYFLQKKGWFGVGRRKAWGTGNKRFLRTIFENRKKYASHRLKRDVNFYEDILEPLFYNILAEKRTNDWSDRFHSKIPFLNGGLFEAIYGYDWTNLELLIPDTLFSNNDISDAGDKGTGILDVFDRYNFTVREAEPLEVEVAVDPEMLGKIFENLLPENIRRGSGTYYTPREIVTYMCQQSLINYLVTRLTDDVETQGDEDAEKEETRTSVSVSESNISHEDIENFIRFGSLQRDYTATGAKIDEKKFLPENIIKNAEKTDELLKEMTVCDPAIGSGAFPVGMMQEVVKAREALQAVEGFPQKSNYELKRETIEHSLYGVDLDPGAVEIAKLRLWLSLIVDEDDYKKIKPLPNLDYKIMQGNSLLDDFHGIKLIDDKIFKQKDIDKQARIKEINKEIFNLQGELAIANVGKHSSIYGLTEKQIKELLRQKKSLTDGESDLQSGLFTEADETQRKLGSLKVKLEKFFDETETEEKDRLRKEIDALEWEFVESKLKAEGKDQELAKLEKHRHDRRKNYFLWQLNFPEIFQAGGFDAVIGNPPYRQLQKEGGKLAKMYESAEFRTFARMGDIYCLFYERGFDLLKPDGVLTYITSNKWMRAGYGKASRKYFAERTGPVSLIDFAGEQIFENATVDTNILTLRKSSGRKKTDACVVKERWNGSLSSYVKENNSPIEFKADQSWVVLSPIEQRINEKIERIGTPLKDWDIRINYGIKTGYNEAFIIDGEKKNELIAQDPKSAEIIRPILRGQGHQKIWVRTLPISTLSPRFRVNTLTLTAYQAKRDF